MFHVSSVESVVHGSSSGVTDFGSSDVFEKVHNHTFRRVQQVFMEFGFQEATPTVLTLDLQGEENCAQDNTCGTDESVDWRFQMATFLASVDDELPPFIQWFHADDKETCKRRSRRK